MEKIPFCLAAFALAAAFSAVPLAQASSDIRQAPSEQYRHQLDSGFGESWDLLFPQPKRQFGDRLAAGKDGTLVVFNKFRIEQFAGTEEVAYWLGIHVEDLWIDESGRIWVAGFSEDGSRCLKVRRLQGGEWQDLMKDCNVEAWVTGAKLFLLDPSTGWLVRFGQRIGWSFSKRFSVDQTRDGGQSWERLFEPALDPPGR